MTQEVVAAGHNIVTPVSVDANGDVITDSAGNPAANVVISQPQNIYVSAQVVAAGAALANWEMWNPADSGVNLVINHLTFNTDVAGTFNVYRATQVLSTEITTGSSGLDPNASTALAEFYKEDGAATTGTTKISEFAILQNVDIPCWWLTGFTLAPGGGLRFQHTQNSAKLKPKLSWQEISI